MDGVIHFTWDFIQHLEDGGELSFISFQPIEQALSPFHHLSKYQVLSTT
jgi:hypothetical protein